MIKYPCPICNRRACDSNKYLSLAKLSENNESRADVVIKCQNCKNTLAVKVLANAVVFEQTSPQEGAIS